MADLKSWSVRLSPLAVGLGLLLGVNARVESAQRPAANAEYAVRPLVQKYCLDCHSTKDKKGSLDLERYATTGDIRKDLKPWLMMIEQIETGEMPPKGKPQPSAEERKQLLAWVRGFLESEAKSRSGDPGDVPLRRLSNAEYDATIRDLTGADLKPTREFPADGAAGEGFTNAAEALTDISPALLTKYLNAAKDTADHAVLVPDGFRFSPSKTRRDWTDESIAKLRAFYASYTADGKLPLAPYVMATVRHREVLSANKLTIDEVAAKEKLNPKYLGLLWKTLTDKTPSFPLDSIRGRWQKATEKDVPTLVTEIAAWQAALWKVVPIGSYRHGDSPRQVANDPAASESQALRLAVKPAPGQNEVVLHLTARDLASDGDGKVVWHRPRFEAVGKPPLLLKDYAQFGPAYELDYASAFAATAKYLAVAIESANDRKISLEALAKKHTLDAAFLKRWIEVLAVEPFKKETAIPETVGRAVPLVPLEILSEKMPKNDAKPWISGWRKPGTDLPVLIANASNTTEQIPGRVVAHGISVHPMPKEFVAVVWTSPAAATIRVQGKVAHAHPACGNGIAWWLEHRRGAKATVVAEGAVDLGGEAAIPVKELTIEKGDSILLAIDAKDSNHVCDMTEIALSLRQTDDPKSVWSLAADVADSIHDGNPHADKLGNKAVWSFVRGPSRALGSSGNPLIPPNSLLGRWREAAADPTRQPEASKLAEQVQLHLSGPRPAKEKDPDRTLYDNLVSLDSAVLKGVDVARLAKPRIAASPYGLAKDRFSDESLIAPANSVLEIRLPAALFRDREFVVEGKLDAMSEARAVQFQVATTPSNPDVRWDGKSPVVASPKGAGYAKLLAGHATFRSVFPLFLCFPAVVPVDEVVSLKMFHREDEPLIRLFLNEERTKHIDQLWTEHRFVSRQPTAENDYLPQFIGFVTQDQPKELLAYYEGQRPAFQKRAVEFDKDVEAAVPKQLDKLLDFASQAYRRPLVEKEKTDLQTLYRALRQKGAPHEEAFRGVLARLLVSPAFLFRIEHAPPGKSAGPVNDWELATRLSYFLWSSHPDAELRTLAAAGQLRDPKVLAAQVQRMLKDEQLRNLAIEFGAQWIHVRGFDELKEKNEKLFPTFDAKLRQAIYEETILFFQDLFQSDRPVLNLLDADYAFLNETLAKHYGIPGVAGPQWRKVEGVKKHGRGGVLGLASVQTKEAGASRTSPILRGNWLVETLLGEKLPRPPANVPQLPEEDGGLDKLTVKHQVERHTRDANCAVCHQRIDPFGFALEKYDPIGRLREKDLGGLPVDAKAKLKDGTGFDGLDGLRNYLLTKKKDAIVRLFCKRLLGYALGRSVTLSDTALLDEMVAELNKNEGRISAAVFAIVRSPQFRMVRGADTIGNE